MTDITKDTLVRVCRSRRLVPGSREYGQPELFFVAPLKNVERLLGLRHPAAIRRVTHELQSGSILSLLYDGDECFGVGLENVPEPRGFRPISVVD